ncbi:hypothetical protein Sgleb_06790 [Streptomyces glebosus]|uniref:Uncharacterized protein n=1 Tax=Streptomyces glebosus TaxID=249580 RepID=A0A640SPA9_9ACTN|nr:hypothetical protein Sgleb_06790 [Streptomyces glebosus]
MLVMEIADRDTTQRRVATVHDREAVRILPTPLLLPPLHPLLRVREGGDGRIGLSFHHGFGERFPHSEDIGRLPRT